MKIKNLFRYVGRVVGALALSYAVSGCSFDKSVIRYPVDNYYGVFKYDNNKCRLTCVDGKTRLNRRYISCEDVIFRVKWENKGKPEISDAVKEEQEFNCKGLQDRIAVDAYEK